jgi:hypothetical protein
MEENGATFALTLTGEGVNITKQVSKSQALGVISIALGSNSAFSLGNEIEPTQPLVDTPKVKKSLGEFLTESGASSSYEKITAIGAYLQVFKGQEVFTKDDVVAGYRGAREVLPKNLGRDIGRAVELRLIDLDSDGKYYVTNTGTKAVESSFSKSKLAK